MMSLKRWLALWTIFIGYLFFGAFIFYTIERRYERKRHVEQNIEQLQLQDLLLKYYSSTSQRIHQQLMSRLREHCRSLCRPSSSSATFTTTKSINADDSFQGLFTITAGQTDFSSLFPLPSNKQDEVEDPVQEEVEDPVQEEIEEEFQWTFYNSFFFALTTLSTIGYGNLHPTSSVGRILVIFYSLLGIPLNGIVLTQLAELFASTFLRVHERYKGKRFETRFVLVVDIVTYLIPGVLVFIFLPSGIFVYFEGWTFDESVYFAYVTLTTIGYGDYVAGQTTKDKRWFAVYKIILMLWIMFGLGYLVMILGFISRAMRCKQMARLEQKLAQNLKQTHTKIWNGFSKDVNNIRRILNELYLLKFKPVYRDRSAVYANGLRNRSQSAPNLTEWPTAEKHIIDRRQSDESSCLSEFDHKEETETKLQFEKYKMRRRQGLSQNILKQSMLRVRSEGDLSEIDKIATFGTAASVEQNELLARVVDVLGTTYGIEQSDSEDEQRPYRAKGSRYGRKLSGDGGVQGFGSDEILSSEWAGNDEQQPAIGVPLNRSCSIPLGEEYKHQDTTISNYPEQWTWPGRGASIVKTSLNVKIPYVVVKNADNGSNVSPNTGGGKVTSLLVPGVNQLRRMSTAALNFITNKRFSSHDPLQDEEAATSDIGVEHGMKKTRMSGRGKSNFLGGEQNDDTTKRVARYSLCDTEYETMCDYINHLTQREFQQANILQLLNHHQMVQDSSSYKVSPVFEQTTVGDFIRILKSIRKLSVSGDACSSISPPKFDTDSAAENKSPLFSLFSNSSETRIAGEHCCRRSPKQARRYSSFSQRNVSARRSTGNRRLSSVAAMISKPFSNFSSPNESTVIPVVASETVNRGSDYQHHQITVPTITITPTELSASNSQHIRRFSIRPASLAVTTTTNKTLKTSQLDHYRRRNSHQSSAIRTAPVDHGHSHSNVTIDPDIKKRNFRRSLSNN